MVDECLFVGQKLPLPDHYTSALRSTITGMLTKDPKQRPSAANILSSSVIQEFQRNPQRVRDWTKVLGFGREFRANVLFSNLRGLFYFGISV